MKMTARDSLILSLLELRRTTDFPGLLRKQLWVYRIQVKSNRPKEDNKTARQIAYERILDAFTTHVGAIHFEDLADILHDFRVQYCRKTYPRKAEENGRKKAQERVEAEITNLREHRDAAEQVKAISYGPVGGGPRRSTGSMKMCPKCHSIGLHLVSGYKERHYSCVYCGYHREHDAKTFSIRGGDEHSGNENAP